MCALTAGCIRTPQDYLDVNIQSTSQIESKDDSEIRSERAEDEPEAVVIENPDETKIYVYRTLKLPDSTYNADHELELNDESSTITINYSSESVDQNGLETSGVIEPRPYWVEIEFAIYQEGTTIEINTIADETFSYSLTGSETIGEMS